MRERRKTGKAPSVPDEPGEELPRIPWTTRLWASIGLPWIIVGVVTYTLLTIAGRWWLHDPAALEVLRQEVPTHIYDRSTSIFVTALAIDILNVVFERQTIKIDCVLLPAFIKGMASTTNILVRFYTPVTILTESGRPVVAQRYICWMHTTPSILMLLKMISTSITPRETLTAIFFDEIMVITGLAALATRGWQRVLWAIVTHVAMLPVVPYMHKAFTECMAAAESYEARITASWNTGMPSGAGLLFRAMEQLKTRPLQLTMLCIYVLNLGLWCMFAITWDLGVLGLISVEMEEVMLLCCDFSAKVLFSSTLMLSSFKGIEARRESAMRFIETSSKAKLIAELQALLEQKERFMSSVSHELRTPLNGIIGISEGMLSGCCGVLPEGVRRQIYIIRTSGARLLALINDVMDAAALRQNKLVLKQEQVVLRHVVDDVLDLTRSLVDTEVQLVNLVPPRMLVVGDSGRIVQILNNLLGNASKFTRRGQIRVSARQVEAGRKVAVTVSDTGIGIPRNKLATIFLPFEQVDMSISRKYGGFGLGLNIVQELVKAHGGTINVSSIEGKGSAFTFTLPLVRALGRESLEEGRAAAARANGSIAGGSGGDAGGGGAVPSVSGSGSGAPATVGNVSPRVGPGTNTTEADDDSIVVSSSELARRGGQAAAGRPGVPPPDAELEQYGELPYNAAELSALASSRPYATPARDASLAIPTDSSFTSSAPGSRTRTISHGGMVVAGGPSRSGLGRGGPGDSINGMGELEEEREGATAVLPAGSAKLQGDNKIVHGPKPFHFTMYKRFLLLSVDDDMVNQNVIKSLLGSTGYEVVTVSSGPEALRYVASSPALPDLVLLDCMMPEMDGYEVLQRLRAMTPNTHLPIIMVSAQTEEEHVVCGLDLGADDYVTKPFKRNELLARIRAQLAYGEWEQAEASGMDTLSSYSDLPAEGRLTAAASAPGGISPAAAAVAAARAAAAAVNSNHGDNASANLNMLLDSGHGTDSTLARGGGGGVGGVGADERGGAALGGGGGAGGVGHRQRDQRVILCIDDDEVNQLVLQGMLTSQNYKYLRAGTGAQGLAYVVGPNNGGIPPDLVLLDCSLPDMSGFDVCRAIRQMYNKQQVPVLMLSARHNESAVVEGLMCGANTYVTKPFRRNELLARIRLNLRARQQDSLGRSSFSLHPGDAPGHATPTNDASHGTAHAPAAALTAAGAPVGSSGDPSRAASARQEPYDAAATPAAADGVATLPATAVLVVAVADFGGLCNMLLPAEMAAVSAQLLSAFERVVSVHGAVRIEASSGVLAAALLPPPGTTGPLSRQASGGMEASGAGPGLRLASLHRLGRALLEAATMIPVPGTTTCLQLQQALALGTLTAHQVPGPGAAATSNVLYFGPILAELLDLARRSPPMTIVTPDVEAQHLRASGATADIRGPLFLELPDHVPTADAAAAAASALSASPDTAPVPPGLKRLWLVEAHPLSYQYLPPQLLYDNHMRGPGSHAHPPPPMDDSDKASVSVSVATGTPPGSMRRPAHGPSGPSTGTGTGTGSVTTGTNGTTGSGGFQPAAGGVGLMAKGTGSPAASVDVPAHGPGGSQGQGQDGHGPSSMSVSLAAGGLSIYSQQSGHLPSMASRGPSRVLSHTFGLDMELMRQNVGGGSTGQSIATAGSGGQGRGAGGAAPDVIRGMASNPGTSSHGQDASNVSLNLGLPFNLHAAAASRAGGGSVHDPSHSHGANAFVLAGSSGFNPSTLNSGSYIYGAPRPAPVVPGGGNPHVGAVNMLGSTAAAAAAAAQGGGSHGNSALDPTSGNYYMAGFAMGQEAELAAAEPQIRALRSELAAMRHQLDALASVGGAHQHQHHHMLPQQQQQAHVPQQQQQLQTHLLASRGGSAGASQSHIASGAHGDVGAGGSSVLMATGGREGGMVGGQDTDQVSVASSAPVYLQDKASKKGSKLSRLFKRTSKSAGAPKQDS